MGTGKRSSSVGRVLKAPVWRRAAASSFGGVVASRVPRLTGRFDITMPLVADVGDHALGDCLKLALACDHVIATHNRVLALPEPWVDPVSAGGVCRLARQHP